MVKMIIAPLLFATLVTGIAGHGDVKQLGKIGIKTIVYFEVVTTLALVIGLTMGNIFNPGKCKSAPQMRRINGFYPPIIKQIFNKMSKNTLS